MSAEGMETIGFRLLALAAVAAGLHCLRCLRRSDQPAETESTKSEQHQPLLETQQQSTSTTPPLEDEPSASEISLANSSRGPFLDAASTSKSLKADDQSSLSPEGGEEVQSSHHILNQQQQQRSPPARQETKLIQFPDLATLQHAAAGGTLPPPIPSPYEGIESWGIHAATSQQEAAWYAGLQAAAAENNNTRAYVQQQQQQQFGAVPPTPRLSNLDPSISSAAEELVFTSGSAGGPVNPFAEQRSQYALAEGADPWAGIPSAAAGMERSGTLRSTASERRLLPVSEDIESVRSSYDVDVRLALKLDVIAGPSVEQRYVTGEDTLDVTIGRGPDNHLILQDPEVSTRHAVATWSSVSRCWYITDLGSLNGTLLNGEPIGAVGRSRGGEYRLSSDDILQFGGGTRVKVSTFPRELLEVAGGGRRSSLQIGSLPRTLTMPKHRIPSFNSLQSPKINSSPSKKATVAAASDELRLECCIASRTGRDHARRGQLSEDVACAECPLHGADEALGEGRTAALFCVFDGHCGRGAAEAASFALPDEVSARLAGVKDDLESGQGMAEAFREAFLAADARIASEEGCTATAVLAWRDSTGAVYLQAGNVGDSLAMFIDTKEEEGWQELTEDHRLTNPKERERLARTGIPLAGGTRRLYGLNLARALGDRFLKDEDLGLSAEPSVSPVIRIPAERGGLILIASDGLWDVTDFEKVAAAARQVDKEQDGSVVQVARAVANLAKKGASKDDVTVLCVRVWSDDEWELRSPTRNLDDGRMAAFEG